MRVDGANGSVERLQNIATVEAYRYCADSIFISESDEESYIEAWEPSSAATVSQRDKVSRKCDGLASDWCVWLPGDVAKPDVDHVQLGGDRLTQIDDVEAYLKSPKRLCIFFITKRNSYSQLHVTRSLFEHLCWKTGIGTRFADYLVYFGQRNREIEIAPPPFACGKRPTCAPGKVAAIQMMGIVRFVERNSRTDEEGQSTMWSIRQTALSCVVNDDGRISWLFISLSPAVEKIVKAMLAPGDHITSSPFWTLLILYHFAVCNWRPYLVALVTDINDYEDSLFSTTVTSTGAGLDSFEMRYDLLSLEKRIIDAKLAIDSTRADLEFLRTEIHSLATSIPKDDQDYGNVKEGLAQCIRDLDVNLMRIGSAQARLQGITSSLTSYLDHSGNQNLQQLTSESKTENENMRKLNEKMKDLAEKNAEEAVTVTVMALLTLIYLPLTVVSNFFSTSFVNLGPSQDRIYVTADWWILFVVAVPLTVLTVYIWRVWAQIKGKRQYPFWWSFLGLKKQKLTNYHEERWSPDFELGLNFHRS